MEPRILSTIGCRLITLLLACGISLATSFTGPGSITHIGTGTTGPSAAACQSALNFASTLSIADTLDGYRVSGDVVMTSTGLDASAGIGACPVFMFFVRPISEPSGTVLSTESSMSGTVDTDGPFQLFGSVFGYFTNVSGRNTGGCGITAAAPLPGAGTGIAFSAGPLLSAPCTLNAEAETAGLQGVFLTAINDQPGEITFHFDSLVSEAHVQAIPEPSSGFTVFLGLVVVVVIARQIRAA
jgi:hypothetical protein